MRHLSGVRLHNAMGCRHCGEVGTSEAALNSYNSSEGTQQVCWTRGWCFGTGSRGRTVALWGSVPTSESLVIGVTPRLRCSSKPRIEHRLIQCSPEPKPARVRSVVVIRLVHRLATAGHQTGRGCSRPLAGLPDAPAGSGHPSPPYTNVSATEGSALCASASTSHMRLRPVLGVVPVPLNDGHLDTSTRSSFRPGFEFVPRRCLNTALFRVRSFSARATSFVGLGRAVGQAAELVGAASDVARPYLVLHFGGQAAVVSSVLKRDPGVVHHRETLP